MKIEAVETARIPQSRPMRRVEREGDEDKRYSPVGSSITR
jgi:hypothetical protein